MMMMIMTHRWWRIRRTRIERKFGRGSSILLRWVHHHLALGSRLAILIVVVVIVVVAAL